MSSEEAESLTAPDEEEEGTEETEEEEGEEEEGEEEGEKEPSDETEGKDGDSLKEIVKRFGEGSDKDLMGKVWKAYRNMENESQKKAGEFKNINELVEAFGGADNLRAALANNAVKPRETAGGGGTKASYPPKIQSLIDSGHLDPEDPKDQVTLAIVSELSNLRTHLSTKAQSETQSSFENTLKSRIGEKYPDLNLKPIRDAAYTGQWKGLSYDKFWEKVDEYAGELNEEIEGRVSKRVEEKTKKLKRNADGSIVRGKQTDTGPGKKSARQAFEATYSAHFGRGED